MEDLLSIRDGVPEKMPESDKVFELYRGAIQEIFIFML